MKKIPELSKYVKLLIEKYNSQYNYDAIDFKKDVIEITEFIRQKTNISHFVPAVMKDGVWLVLEEPNSDNYISDDWPTGENEKYWFDLEEYQTALGNVVFKNVSKSVAEYYLLTVNTIEDLIPYNLEITDIIAERFKL